MKTWTPARIATAVGTVLVFVPAIYALVTHWNVSYADHQALEKVAELVVNIREVQNEEQANERGANEAILKLCASDDLEGEKCELAELFFLTHPAQVSAPPPQEPE